MIRNIHLLAAVVLLFFGVHSIGQTVDKFDRSGLVEVGDTVKYGSYEIIKVGSKIYQIKDYGDPKALSGGLVGTDMYMILGRDKALIVDLGNNYIAGYKGDAIPPRKNAEAEFLAIVDGLRGKLPVEAAITHAHPDHDGMTMALADRKATIWMPKGEDMEAPRTQHGIDPRVYTVFDQQTKRWDLGGGRVVTPILVRGHTAGCSVYLLASEMMLFTGDCLGNAERSLRTAEQLKMWAEDTARLVSFMKTNFKPFDRYRLIVFPGHTRGVPIEGFASPDHPQLDLAYLDWRFVQDQALLADGIVKGLWLKPDSGLSLVDRPLVSDGTFPASPVVHEFVYGVGAADMPIAEAYIAAGLNPPGDGATK